MVIVSSTSCETLIDLNEYDPKHTDDSLARNSLLHEPSYKRTEIQIPSDDYDYDDECDAMYEKQGPASQQFLHVPSGPASVPIDRHLGTVPEIADNAEMLLANPPRHLSRKSGRVLNICQGELGHAVPSQCDIIASGDVTTCHIVVIRSMGSAAEPLSSLAHVDKAGYEDCIRGMIQEHKAHHSPASSFVEDEREEKKDEDLIATNNFQMDLHIVGGFNDEEGSSLEISEFLIELFTRLAQEEKGCISMTLRTCVLSSMNDTGLSCPIGRGLGLDLHSGEVYLASIGADVRGPETDLRSARLWTSNRNSLSVVHTAKSDTLSIQPFKFQVFRGLDAILSLPDDVILRHTSTSPDVESSNFCYNVRSTLRYMRDNEWNDIFGISCDTSVRYTRSRLNKWKLVANNA